LVAKFIH